MIDKKDPEAVLGRGLGRAKGVLASLSFFKVHLAKGMATARVSGEHTGLDEHPAQDAA